MPVVFFSEANLVRRGMRNITASDRPVYDDITGPLTSHTLGPASSVLGSLSRRRHWQVEVICRRLLVGSISPATGKSWVATLCESQRAS